MGGIFLGRVKLPFYWLNLFLIGVLLLKPKLRTLIISFFIILAFFRAVPLFPPKIDFQEVDTSFTLKITKAEKVRLDNFFLNQEEKEIWAIKGEGKVINGPSFYPAPSLKFFLPEKVYSQTGESVVKELAVKEPLVNDIYVFWGRLRDLRPRMNPYGFSEEEYYENRGLSGVLTVSKLERVKVQNSPIGWLKWEKIEQSWKVCSWFFGKKLLGLRNYLYHNFQKLPYPAKDILPALTLGIKPKGEVLEVFRSVGASHLLVVSGLHFALLFSFLYSLLRKIPYSKIMLMIGLLGFFLLVGATPSSLRALIMIGLPLIYLPGINKRKRTYSFSVLFSAGALVLLILPYSLYDLSFYLSFGATAGIILISPKLRELKPLRLLPSFLQDNLSVTLGANLFILPLLLYNFLELPIYMVPANLIGSFFLTFLLPLSWAFLLLHPLPIINLIIKSLITGLSFFLMEAFKFLKSLPYSSLLIPFPWLIGLLIAIATLVVFYFLIRKTNLLPEKFNLAVVTIFPVCVLILALRLLTPTGFELVFLYAGQGDGTILRTPSGKVFLIDAGSKKEDGINYLRILSRWGKTSIDGLIITHPHGDHYLGAEDLLNKGYVKRIYSNSATLNHGSFSEFLNSLNRTPVINKVDDVALIKDKDLVIKFIPPPDSLLEGFLEPNNLSVLVEISTQNYEFLITGDAPLSLLANYQKDIDVLRTPHHGAKNSLKVDFLKRTQPEVAVISAGIKNPFGHPHPETLNLLKEEKVDYFITSKDGAITFRIQNKRLIAHKQVN